MKKGHCSARWELGCSVRTEGGERGQNRAEPVWKRVVTTRKSSHVEPFRMESDCTLEQGSVFYVESGSNVKEESGLVRYRVRGPCAGA